MKKIYILYNDLTGQFLTNLKAMCDQRRRFYGKNDINNDNFIMDLSKTNKGKQYTEYYSTFIEITQKTCKNM